MLRTKLFLLSFTPLLISPLIIINNGTNSNNNINKDTVTKGIIAPSTNTINQTYKTNWFDFNKFVGANETNLISRNNNLNYQHNNYFLPFAKVINSKGIWDGKSYMENTLEFDLNTWKPIGMEDDLFLKSISFNINGFTNSNLESQTTKLINYNISKENFESGKAPENFDNLGVKEVTYIDSKNPPLPEEKLVFNLLNINKDFKYKNNKYGYCYIILKVVHEKSHENHGSANIDAINRLLITPKISYHWTNKTDRLELKTIIPTQDIKLSLSSSLFSYNEYSRISIDSYVSDNQRFNLFEKIESENNNSFINPFLTIDTYKDNNEIILSSDSSFGSNIKELEIDTSNFYFSNDYNQLKNKNFLVEIEGIKVQNGFIIKNQNDHDNPPNMSNNQRVSKFFDDNESKKLNLSFLINDEEFNHKDMNYEKIIDFDLFNQSMILNVPNVKNLNAGIKLEIGIKAQFDTFGNRIPFKYKINFFKFSGKKFINRNGEVYTLDSYLQVLSSNEVIVKTRPLDFSFTKMSRELLSTQKEEYQFQSNYSSNVFDDTNFLDENNLKVKTNYQRAHEELNKKFQLILNTNEFRNAMLNVNLLNTPFSQIQYTSYGDEYRTKGKMNLKFAPKNNNKYFKYLEVILRAKINKNKPQNEIVEIKFNQQRLNEIAKNIKTMDVLIDKLNQLKHSQDEMEKLFNNISYDETNVNNPFINFNSLTFEKILNTNYLQAKFDLTQNHYMLIEQKLINKNIVIKSDYIKIETFNPNKIIASANEELIRKIAVNLSDYNEFKAQFKSEEEIKKILIISDKASVEKVEFINDNNSQNKIIIKVTLFEGFVFNNDTKEEIITIANINWKDQNNKVKALKINLNYNLLAKKLLSFNSAHDFINQNQNPNLKEWMGIINFETPNNGDGTPTSINDIASIKFELVSSSLRKIKVIVQAKEWRYFEFVGSSIKDDQQTFIISNITWNGESESSLIGLNINLDMPYLYQLMIKYFKKYPSNNLQDFINVNRKNFIVYGKNDISIIKINPYDEMSLNPPVILTSKEGISISFEINEGFYWNKNNNYNNDRFISTYQKFISIDEIKKFHEEFIKPNPKNLVNEIRLNANKLANDVQEFKNIDQFLNQLDDYAISEYLSFTSIEDIKKIDQFKVKKIDAHAFEIQIKIFDQFYFWDEEVVMKTKSFIVQNLIFKNETNKLKPIVIGINRQLIANKAREFYSRDEMVKFYENKFDFQDYQEFFIISKQNIEAIETVKLISGPSLNTIQLVIKIKSGYYFSDKNPIIAQGKITISNLLFKNDPLPEDIFVALKIIFKGNEFLNRAREFNSFTEIKTWLEKQNENETYNWNQFLDISFNKENENNKDAILRFNIFQKSEHKLVVKIILNEGYYFENQNYTINEAEIIVGNVFLKNQTITDLKDIDIRFNKDKFYKLTKDFSIESWDQLIELISPEIMNFKDSYNAILWSNADNKKVFNVIKVFLNDNDLCIRLELNDGFFFDNDDQSNVRIDLKYSKDELTKLYDQGYKKINDAIIKRNWIISLSIIIPFITVFTIIGLWAWRTKIQNKNNDLKGEN